MWIHFEQESVVDFHFLLWIYEKCARCVGAIPFVYLNSQHISTCPFPHSATQLHIITGKDTSLRERTLWYQSADSRCHLLHLTLSHTCHHSGWLGCSRTRRARLPTIARMGLAEGGGGEREIVSTIGRKSTVDITLGLIFSGWANISSISSANAECDF